MEPRNDLPVISLFSGAGGLDLGFESAGFRIAVALESDSSCCNTLTVNRPNLPVINSKIEDTSTAAILAVAGLQPLEAALVIGGPPCQSFSLAGLRKGLDDERGRLLFEYVRVVREALPIGFVLENVKGLMNWNAGKALQMLIAELSKPILYQNTSYVYTVSEPRVLNAVDYGVPQHRERVVLIGNRNNLPYNYPEPNKQGNATTVWSAIGNLPAPAEPSATAKRVSGTISERRVKHGF